MADTTFVADCGEFPFTPCALLPGSMLGSGSFAINPRPTFGCFGPKPRDVRALTVNARGNYLVPLSGAQYMARKRVRAKRLGLDNPFDTADVAEICLNTIEGTAAAWDFQNGRTWTQVAVVTNINGNQTDTTGSFYDEALTALVAITGDRGTQSTEISEPNYLAAFTPEEIKGTQGCKIRIHYKGYPIPKIRLRSCLAETPTNLDTFGQAIVLEYTYGKAYGNPLAQNKDGTDGQAGDKLKAGKLQSQSILVNKKTPEALLEWSFTIIGPQPKPDFYFGQGDGSSTISATDYATWLASYMGNVSNDPISFGCLGGTPRQWMIEAVESETYDGGFSAEVKMTYHYKAITWDELCTYVNPDDGMPPYDVSDKGTQPNAQLLKRINQGTTFPTVVTVSN